MTAVSDDLPPVAPVANTSSGLGDLQYRGSQGVDAPALSKAEADYYERQEAAEMANRERAVDVPADKSVEDCMRLADEYSDQSRRQQVGMPSSKRAALYDAIVAYGDAQWNAAIEAAVKECEQLTGLTPMGCASAIRGLKR